MERRREDTLTARPGHFGFFAALKAKDNTKATKSNKLTHLRLVCEICGQEDTTTIHSAEAVGYQFDKHPCKPVAEWPELPEASPRQNPADLAAERERVRRELDEE